MFRQIGDELKRVTYPHLGTLYITVEHFFRALGLEAVTPPFSSRRTLDLGVRHCPEMTCAPCKILFGNYYEGLEIGADDVVVFGGPDTCRLGYLARPQSERLHEDGFRFTTHTLSMRGVAGDLLRVTRDLADPSPRELVEGARTLIASVSLVDEIDQETLKLRPRERERGTATRLQAQAWEAVRGCADRAEIQARKEAILAPLRDAPRDTDCQVLLVALLGDLYSISEPFFNMNLEQQLGYLGVEVDRWHWLSNGIHLPSLDRYLPWSETQARAEETARYLGRDVGGFALPSLMGAVDFVSDGVDGLIHMAPFNCTPEIVAASVLPRLARDYDVPLLALAFDEHSGQAGLATRLEAFVDLLERRGRRVESAGDQANSRLPKLPGLKRAGEVISRGRR